MLGINICFKKPKDHSCDLLSDSRILNIKPGVIQLYGFGGLVVSMLASDTQVRRSRWIFTGVKILSMPSSGGEVKESVPCPSYAACQRS